MTCGMIQSLLPIHAGGDLDPEQAGKVEAHLNGCANCQDELQALTETTQWVRSLDPLELDPVELARMRAALMTRLKTEKAKSGSWSRRWSFVNLTDYRVPALATISVICTVIVGFLLLYSPDRVPPPSQGGTPPAPRRTTNSAVDIPRQEATNPLGRRRSSKRPQVVSSSISRDPTLVVTNEEERDHPNQIRIEMQTADPNIRIIWFAEHR